MNTTRTTKPYMNDCFGNALSTLSIERLTEIYEAMKLERKQNSFWNEGIRYQRKHTATISYLEKLINS